MFNSFDAAIGYAQAKLMMAGEEVDTGRWQGYPTAGKADLVTKEVMNLTLEVPMYRSIHTPGDLLENLQVLREEIQPNLPWADRHFEERVAGLPANPGYEYQNWPWWRGQTGVTNVLTGRKVDVVSKEHAHPASIIPEYEFKFSHTYMERFWPKEAGHLDQPHKTDRVIGYRNHRGIRYDYGDLDDVVQLLFEEPATRQATFPIFFPEDTGCLHRGRIPCTLHYHFMLRDRKLHMWYPIRSCDLVRHFRDDLYMACRLNLWVIQQLIDKELRSERSQIWVDAYPGTLHFTAYSFHVHKGDMHLVA